MIEIIKTEPGDAHFHLFENLPADLYPADSIRFKLPDILNRRFLQSCFVVMRQNKVCARAALYNNPKLTWDGKKAFCIGNYESAEDFSPELFLHLFSETKGKADFLIGPMNGSTWDNYRFSTHHNYPNFFLEPWHHLYYNEHFINAGFYVIAKYYSSIDISLKYDSENILAREKELKNAGVTFRNIDLTHYEEELEKLFAFNSIAFKKNFLYTPVDKEDFIKKYRETKGLINSDFAIMAEDRNNELIGYFFCIDDKLNTKEKSLIIKTIARHPDKIYAGLGHVIGNMIYREAAKQDYKSIIHAFMYEAGTSTTISKNFSGDIYKNYVLYGRSI